MFCAAEGKPVPPEKIVKGFQIAPDQYVTLSDKELESVAAEKSRPIEITDFVSLDDIDPIYYDQPYYVSPDERAAKAYRLLATAMEQSKKVGLGLS